MALTLGEYIRQGMSEPFVWGARDCCLWPCDWVLSQTGIDPAAHLRGTYTTKIGAARRIAPYGGFEPMWRTCMARSGFATTGSPVPGDVAVVLDGPVPIAAIRLSKVWAAKASRGLVIEDFPMLAAWSVRRG